MNKMPVVVLTTMLLVVLGVSVAHAQPAPFRVGAGMGMVLSDSVLAFQGLAQLSPISWLNLRLGLEVFSFFGIVVVPIDGMLVLQFGEVLRPYFGAGAGVLMMKSEFGTAFNPSYSLVQGIEFGSRGSIFLQLKYRNSGAGETFQIDIGVIL